MAKIKEIVEQQEKMGTNNIYKCNKISKFAKLDSAHIKCLRRPIELIYWDRLLIYQQKNSVSFVTQSISEA